VHESDHEDSGRLSAVRVTALGPGVDGTVRGIGREYDSLGRLLRVTQYDAATGGSVLDQVQYAHDGWGNLVQFQQDHDSAIGGTLLYGVDFAHAKATGGPHTIRRTSM